jgi:hypothetical protein
LERADAEAARTHRNRVHLGWRVANWAVALARLSAAFVMRTVLLIAFCTYSSSIRLSNAQTLRTRLSSVRTRTAKWYVLRGATLQCLRPVTRPRTNSIPPVRRECRQAPSSAAAQVPASGTNEIRLALSRSTDCRIPDLSECAAMATASSQLRSASASGGSDHQDAPRIDRGTRCRRTYGFARLAAFVAGSNAAVRGCGLRVIASTTSA